ncbi:MAG: aldo/keto reductase, partial [Thermomicrobiales bacterium]
METRCFGASALCSSVIGFGTWPIGGARYGPSDDAEAIDASRAALDGGVTFFDTAPSYGNGHAEEVLGKALTGRREQAIIATKGGMIWDEKSFVLGQNSSLDYLVSGLESSLKRLGTEYVDCFLLHWPDDVTAIDEIGQSLHHIVESGKARFAGVCNLDGDQLRTIVAAAPDRPIVASQVGFSLFDRRWADETFASCRELGLGTMAYGPLAHGLLTGAMTRETVLDTTDWRAAGVIFGQPLLTPENRERNFAVVDALHDFARSHGVTLPQLAIAWVLHHDVVTVALTGARHRREILETIGASQL